MAKPKLALIPAAQGSKFYSVLPSSGVGDFDFTRSGSATRINSQGLIETVSNGVSRLNYPLIDGKVVGCPSHLLEPQRTNLITYSEDFTQWSNVLYTLVESNSTLSPDGSVNADKLVAGATNGLQLRIAPLSLTSGNTYTFSTYVKNSGGNYVILYMNDTDSQGIKVDLVNETFLIMGSSTNHFIKNFGNGWYQIGFTRAINANVNGLNAVPSLDGNSVSFLGDGVNGVFIWGAQVEESSYATSYIPTNGSSVTRSAESANGSGDASTFNDSEGVLMVETKVLVADTRIGISNSDNSDQVLFGNANGIFYRITENNANPITQFIEVSQFENHKIALKYKSTETSIFIDGFELNTNSTSYSLSGLNELAFVAQGYNFYGNTKQVQYYNSALTDSELETLTSWTSFSDMANGQLYTIE